MDPREWQDNTPLSDPIFTPRDVPFDESVEERPEEDADSFAAIAPPQDVEAVRRRYSEEFDRLVSKA